LRQRGSVAGRLLKWFTIALLGWLLLRQRTGAAAALAGIR